MVAAMLVGMLVLHPVWMFLFPLLGWSVALERPDLHTLLMATDMTLGMTAWMRYRGHRWRPVAEMASAMYLPFVVLIGPLWVGLITGTTLFVAGHLLMLPAMLGVMLLARTSTPAIRRVPRCSRADEHQARDVSARRDERAGPPMWFSSTAPHSPRTRSTRSSPCRSSPPSGPDSAGQAVRRA